MVQYLEVCQLAIVSTVPNCNDRRIADNIPSPDDIMNDDVKRASFDLAMSGSRDAIDRIDSGKSDFQRTVVEAVWWLGSAIDSMKLQRYTADLNAGIYWVRTRGAHFMSVAMRTAHVGAFDAGFSTGFDTTTWRTLKELGFSDPTDPCCQALGYKTYLEGHGVLPVLHSAYDGLQTFRDVYADIYPVE